MYGYKVEDGLVQDLGLVWLCLQMDMLRIQVRDVYDQIMLQIEYTGQRWLRLGQRQ